MLESAKAYLTDAGFWLAVIGVSLGVAVATMLIGKVL